MENREFNYRNYSAGQQLEMSQAFPVLMRKVYVWMTLALAITTGSRHYGHDCLLCCHKPDDYRSDSL